MSSLQPAFFDNLALLATKRIQSNLHMEKKSMQLLNSKNIPLMPIWIYPEIIQSKKEDLSTKAQGIFP